MRFKSFGTIASALCLMIGVSASAQSAGEISAAKSLARSYGYSDSEINAVLNHNIGGTTVVAPTASAPAAAPAASAPAAAPAAAATSMDVPSEVTVIKPAESNTTGTGTGDIYGHSYFTSEGLSVIPSYNAPVPASYVLGPGDDVIVDVWGATNTHIMATIGNDGSISVLDLGPVYLAGMKVRDAESFLKERLSSIYSGLGDGGDTYMRLTVGKIKGVVVNIIGEVKVPGAYTIPSLCSITSAIFMAGGVTDVASVREIVLYRNGRKVSTFDLYEFIFKGKLDENLRLQDGDIISVVPYTTVVSISGAVTRPMRYEMKDGETIQTLIDFAGGFTTYAQKDEVHLTRRDITIGTAYDVKSSNFGSFKLEDGDAVSVRSNPELLSNTATISGPVVYPGAYAITGSMKDVAALIKAAGGLREGAYTGRGQINRLDENRLPVFLTFDLEKVLAGTEVVPLVREDKVTLYMQNEFIEDYNISVSGHVTNPGTFTFHEGMTVADAVLLARGVRDDAYTERGHITRTNHDGVREIIAFNVNDALSGADNIQLVRRDNIRIYSITELIDEADISINGEVKSPKTLVYSEGYTLGDLVISAGGFNNGADLSCIEIATKGGKERGYSTTYNLEENPDLMSLTLKPYDVVSVRRLTYFRPQTTVTVEGEVMHPGSYTIDKTEVRLSDIVAKMDGFTEEAWIHGARLTRHLTAEEQARQREALAIATQNLVGRDTLIVSLTDKFDIGIDLEKAIANPGSDDDVIVRAGDVLSIPALNNTVRITGGVFMPNTVTYVKGKSWKGYIAEAGGFNQLARRGKCYVMYMNGKASTRARGMKMEPGCEIVVPTREEREVREISPAEIAAIASSTSSIATLVVALSRLF